MPKQVNTIVLIGCPPEFSEAYRKSANTFVGPTCAHLVVADITTDTIGNWWTKSLAQPGFLEAVVSQSVKFQYSLMSATFHPSSVISVLVDSAFVHSEYAAWQLKMAFENATFFQVWDGAINDSSLWHYVNTKTIEPLNEKFPWNEAAGQALSWVRDATYGDILQMTTQQICERSKDLDEAGLENIRKYLARKRLYLRGEYEIMKSYS